MVDFKYHVVSIIAVFLALTIGIVFGTAALNGPILNDLRDRVDALTGEKNDLRDQVRAERATVAERDAYVTSLTPLLVADRLSGQSIVMLSDPTTDGAVRDQVAGVLQQGGASVNATVDVEEPFLDAAADGPIDAALDAVQGVPGVSVPTGDTPVEQAASVLAQALVSATPTLIPAATTTAVLTAFTDAGLIATDGPVAPGSMAILVSGPPPARSAGSEDSSGSSAVLVAIAAAFDEQSRGAVIAGPRSATIDGGVLAVLRRDPETSTTVSGVDSVDTPPGLVAVDVALAERLVGLTGSVRHRRGVAASAATPGASASPSATPAPARPRRHDRVRSPPGRAGRSGVRLRGPARRRLRGVVGAGPLDQAQPSG